TASTISPKAAPDPRADPTLRAALEAATASGEIAVSEPAALHHDGSEASAVYLFLPAVHPNGSQFTGFVSTAIRLEALLLELQKSSHIVRAELTDQTQTRGETILAAWSAESAR